MTVTGSIPETEQTATASPATEVAQWSIFELALPGRAKGNPFVDMQFRAAFSYKHRTIEVDGSYDGEEYRGEILDAWQMTCTPLVEPVHNGTTVELEQKPYQAVVLRRS